MRAASLLVLLSLLSETVASERTWTDSSGMFQTKAAFIECTADSVSLKTSDGKTIGVPLTKLSESDRRLATILSTLQAAQRMEADSEKAEFGSKQRQDLFSQKMEKCESILGAISDLSKDDAKFVLVTLKKAADSQYGVWIFTKLVKETLVRSEDEELIASCYESRQTYVAKDAIDAAIQLKVKSDRMMSEAEKNLSDKERRLSAAHYIAVIDSTRKADMVRMLTGWYLERCREYSTSTQVEVDMKSIISSLVPDEAANIFADGDRERSSKFRSTVASTTPKVEKVDAETEKFNDDVLVEAQRFIDAHPDRKERALLSLAVVGLKNVEVAYRKDFEGNVFQNTKKAVAEIRMKGLQPYVERMLRLSGIGDYFSPVGGKLITLEKIYEEALKLE